MNFDHVEINDNDHRYGYYINGQDPVPPDQEKGHIKYSALSKVWVPLRPGE